MKVKSIILAAIVTLGAVTLPTGTAEAKNRHYRNYNNGTVVVVAAPRPYYRARAYPVRQTYYRTYYRNAGGVSVSVNIR